MAKYVSSDLMQYVHVHNTIPLLSLITELSTLHAGILISNRHVTTATNGDTYFPFMGDYFLASKLFDYHEAGLLCLMQPMRVMRRVFPRNGAFREVESLEDIVEIVSNMEVRDIEVSPKHRLDYHAHRLHEFYLRLYRERA